METNSCEYIKKRQNPDTFISYKYKININSLCLLDGFVRGCLQKVGRSELQEKYERLVKRLHNKQNIPHEQVGTTRKASSRRKKRVGKGASLSPEMIQTIYTMAEEVHDVHDTIQSAVSSHNKAESLKKPPFEADFPTEVFRRYMCSAE